MPPSTPIPSGAPARRAGEFTDLVHEIAAAVPRGRATTYGLIREAIAVHAGQRGTALAVGGALARSATPLPWWRVVRADGSIDPRLAAEALAHWRAEGLPMLTGGDEPRLDLMACLWDAPVDWAPRETRETEADDA